MDNQEFMSGGMTPLGSLILSKECIMRENQCGRCGSSMMWQECWKCLDGYSHHDCGEDVCCCMYPADNVKCDVCHGKAGWWVCCSSEEWCQANPLPGKEVATRNTVEWFEVR